MNFLTNAFSLQMLEEKNFNGISTVMVVNDIEIEEVKNLLNKENFISAIGHADTANVVSNILNMDIRMNRINVKLNNVDDIIIVAQVMGGRLPEGATTLPDGIKIQFKEVSLLNMNHFIAI